MKLVEKFKKIQRGTKLLKKIFNCESDLFPFPFLIEYLVNDHVVKSNLISSKLQARCNEAWKIDQSSGKMKKNIFLWKFEYWDIWEIVFFLLNFFHSHFQLLHQKTSCHPCTKWKVSLKLSKLNCSNCFCYPHNYEKA